MIVSHVFIVTNSSVNFLLYCVVGREFREKSMEMAACTVPREAMAPTNASIIQQGAQQGTLIQLRQMD